MIESKSAADYVPNMTILARQGYDLIIGVGYAQGDAIATAAKKFPDTSFAIVDVDQTTLKGKPANVQGLLFREEQVGYLAGYLAALEAKRAGGERDQRRRRLQGAARRPVHRRLQGRRDRGRPGDEGEVGVLAGLGRPGQVQGAGAEPDRGRLEGRLPGRRRLRARSAPRREAAEGVGRRRRRRPVVPRAARADERAQGGRQRRLPDLEGRPGRDVHGRRQRDLRPRPGRRRARHVQPERERGGHRGRRRRSSSRSPTARSPASRRL